jgi:transaldolase/glucose-6-phosphate isomerase
MGGSSLWPEVLAHTFSEAASRTLHVLDSTVPDAIESTLGGLNLDRCLFFVSSKSGSTLEPMALFELIHARLASAVGQDAAGRHFVAITDPGSTLETLAVERGFLGIAFGQADVGGRFSALSPFGMLPAEAAGLDPEDLLARTRTMSAACAPFVSPEINPGVGFGIAMGVAASRGRDKLTLSVSPSITSFSTWIEQLVAESTGKGGQGIVPIAGEALGAPAQYSDDRFFVDIALAGDATNAERSTRLDALEAAGHPVVRIEIADSLDLVQEVFRWEIATAVAGAQLGLNPFDQPDVEAAKLATRELMGKTEQAGGLAPQKADLESDGLRFFVAPTLSDATRDIGGNAEALMKALVGSIQAKDTFVINAFLASDPETTQSLGAIRESIGQSRRVATTLDFGPRYLHSTGQLQKGGPNRVVGLQLWQSANARAQTGVALAIPAVGGTFDTLVEAQAVGDFGVLCDRGRRMIGIDVGADPGAALAKLAGWIDRALA